MNPASEPPVADLDAVVRQALDAAEVEYEQVRPGPQSAYVVTLRGDHKLRTNTWVAIGDHSLLVEAFVVRHPDENVAEFYATLLRRNTRTYGVHFAVDRFGDVYLVGRLPLAAVSVEEVDRLLGCVLAYADEMFDPLLEIGFATAIRKEWQWRVSRGDPVDNLAAFSHLVTATVEEAERPSGDGVADR